MAGDSSPAKKPTRSSRAAPSAATQARDASTSLSPTAAALKALKKLASPAAAATTDPENESKQKASSQTDPENNSSATPSLRIQAPKARRASPRASGTQVVSSGGPATISPAGSGRSVPTSPADDGDGVDTPDSHGRGQAPSKRPRLLAEPSTPTATPPLFLEKTYEMLDKSSPQVACWSRAGDSFIVKNPVAFAEHVIPIYFKHRNFSSFVRQLNFYGFRKVRVVDPDVTGGVDPKDWWEFRHEKFQRGRKELLAEIKRRSLSSGSNGSGSGGSANGAADAAPTATIDRAEIEELRTEVGTLREQIQTLNKHMFSVMQIMMTRTATPTPTPTAMAGGASGPHGLAFTAPPPHSGLHPHHPHHHQHQHHYPPAPPSTPHGLHAYPFVGSLPPPHLMAGPGASAHRHDKPSHQPPRGPGVPASPAGGPGASYALRPIQSFPGAPAGYAYPMTPSSEAAMDWDTYSRHAFHAAQVAQAQAAAAAAAVATASNGASQPQPQLVRGDSAPPPSSVAPPASSVPAVPGLKRARSQPKRTSSTEAAASTAAPSSSTSTLPATPVNPVENPEAAVRQLSMQVSQIRADLLQSILTRTLSFLRAQPAASASTTAPSPEIDATAAAIGHDIQQRLAQVNEAEAATHGRAVAAASETSHMYRVEMLKFVSKELPRAMSEAVEKRLPAATKKALNRSLLALMVQKAQAALEAQMRVETASAAISPSNGSVSGGSSASTSQSSAK